MVSYFFEFSYVTQNDNTFTISVAIKAITKLNDKMLLIIVGLSFPSK